MMKHLFVIFILLSPMSTPASAAVIINEIAWMGSENSHADEWVELKNTGGETVNLDGWILKAADGSPKIQTTGSIPAGEFYLLQRSKDYTGSLENDGEVLELYDGIGSLIDKVDASASWPAGDNKTKQTMEKVLAAPGAANWQTSQRPGGTPLAENSSLPIETPGAARETSGVNATAKKRLEARPLTIEITPNRRNAPLLAAVFTSLSAGVMILLLKRKTHVGT